MRRTTESSTFVGHVMKNNHAAIIMAKEKQIENYFIVLTECVLIGKAIMTTIQKNLQRIII